MSVYGNATGGFGFPKTFVLVDESGNEMTGVIVGEEQVFTATPADVRIGKTFASNEGVSEGENTITYRTEQGSKLICKGSSFSVPLDDYNQYDYTKFQCLISRFNTSFSDSVATDKISLSNAVYDVGSAEQISVVTKNNINKSIDLNIVNDTDYIYVIHYMTYKQEEI